MILIKVYSNFSIFFDETGKSSGGKVQLMGAVGLPNDIYYNQKYLKMRELNKKYNYHWSEYRGDSKQRKGIKQLFEQAILLAKYCYINIIKYSSSDITKKAGKYNSVNQNSSRSIVHDMIYSKLPERIIYGLLRGYGGNHEIVATINIEEANEYKTINLAENLKKQLNIHSLYRGESFIVKDCRYCGKKVEIGVELTDLLIGIVRTILENNDKTSNRKKEQIKLIIYLLRNKFLQPFLKKTRLFELGKSGELKELNIFPSVNMFISKNYNLYCQKKSMY